MTKSFSKEVIALILAAFSGTAAFRLSVPAVAYFSRSALEASALGIGLITSAFFVGRALVATGAGGLADKFRERMTYLATLSFLVNAGVTYTYVYVNSIYEVVFIRFIQGSLNGLGWVSLQYVLGGLVGRKVRGRTYSIYFISGSLGGIVGNYIYSVVSKLFLSRILPISSAFFAMTSLLSLIVALSGRKLIYSQKRLASLSKLRSPGKLKTIYITPIFIALFIVGLSSAGLKGDLIYIYLKEWLGLSRAESATIIATAGLVGLAGNYILSWVADSMSDYLALAISTSLTAPGLILVGITSLPIAVAGLIFFTAGASAILTISRKVAVTFFSRGGFTIGLINAAGNLGSIAGGVLIGYLYDLLRVGYAIYPSIKIAGFQAVVGGLSAGAILAVIPFIGRALSGNTTQ